MRDKTELSAFAVLFVGVGLLMFTFLNAYLFLTEELSILSTQDLVGVFGEALAPLITASIRIMYLGVMGWIGSILTIRGVQLLTQPKREAESEVKPEAKSEKKEVEKVEETKSSKKASK